jgi:hypothetical protein
LHIWPVQLSTHDVLAALMAATKTPTSKSPGGAESQASGGWQIWLILVALSALTGLALKLVSDRPRND